MTSLADLHALPWAIAALGALADIATTAIGLSVGLVEKNAIMAPIVDQGMPSMMVAKLAILLFVAGCYAVCQECNASKTAAIPAAVGIVWLAVSVWNAALIASVIS